MIKRKKKPSTPEINTTALPDIIFMLLFFFMVTTVIQPPDNKEQLVLPNTITDESTDRSRPDELQIIISPSSTDSDQIIINGSKNLIDNCASLISKSINDMKEAQLFPSKAILRIDKSVKMKSVNLIKEILQKEEILNIEYVHRKE
jgi:biopolymer transport protein ExbD